VLYLCVVISDHPHKYNTAHRHGGIGLLTPAMVHYGQADGVRAHRADVLAAAYAAHPERFVRRPPQPPALAAAVWINPPAVNGGPDPRIPDATGSRLGIELPTASRIDVDEGGRYLDTPSNGPADAPARPATAEARQ